MTIEQRVSEVLAAELGKQIHEKEAQLKALDTQINARILTLRELDERIGERLPDLEWRKQVDACRARARAFADALERQGY